LNNDFNDDFGVTISPNSGKGNQTYNSRMYINEEPSMYGEAPGISVFFKNENGEIYHTYSTYARGLEMLLGAYRFMDLTPKGRDENEFPYPMAWIRRHDQYDKVLKRSPEMDTKKA
jgi:predicted dithiol-disulfide oxidoreductase (DUF899 family)